MATGSGKTYTAMTEIYRLIKFAIAPQQSRPAIRRRNHAWLARILVTSVRPGENVGEEFVSEGANPVRRLHGAGLEHRVHALDGADGDAGGGIERGIGRCAAEVLNNVFLAELLPSTPRQ